jgi:hypothetical protein
VDCFYCHALMEPGDVFCGSCGQRSPALAANGSPDAMNSRGNGNGRWPTVAPSVPRQPPPAQETAATGPFFSHTPARSGGRMTNATRYLCAAAYLDAGYAGAVIRELVASARSVAPSVGVDLGPIIRHCLRARNIQLVRDIVLTLLLLIGLITDTGQMILLLIVCFVAGWLPSMNWARRSFRSKALAAVGVLALIAAGLVAMSFVAMIGSLQQSFSQGLTPDGEPAGTGQGGGGLHGLLGPGLLVAILATQLVYTYLRSRTLCDELGPDATPRRPRPNTPYVENRIAQVEGAQHGNVVLYAGANPFVGTGQRTRAWSIAVELRRARNQHDPDPRRARDYVDIDPVALHQVVRQRLLNLKDGALPANQQLQALTVHDHIVGIGAHRWDSPLIDPARNVPYSEASPEAIQAVIRHPQAGVRYYQRVSVCDEGQEVWTGQRKVLDGSDQDISASAFVYAAVEGHMFYLEFVSAVMPPINPRWHLVDLLPKFTPGKFMVQVLVDAVVSSFRDLLWAPIRGASAIAGIIREGRSQQEQAVAAQEYLYGNVGARLSVRELGATRGYHTYIQRLDAEKYTKLTERLVIDTVLDFLAEQGVDTSAYASNAQSVTNQYTHIGDNHGAAAFGPGASAQQTNHAQPARG